MGQKRASVVSQKVSNAGRTVGNLVPSQSHSERIWKNDQVTGKNI